MTQTHPSYIQSIGKIEANISINLCERYGRKNILNIICFGKIDYDKTIFYILEKNRINSKLENYPKSKNSIPFVYLDLKSNVMKLNPNYNELQFLLNEKYKSLMDFMLSSSNTNYYSIDIDYVFKSSKGWKGFEFTTFYMPFKNKKETERLVSKINLRPSWKGVFGARALKRIVKNSEDLNIDLYMVCANTTKRVGSKLDLSGNCYVFKLNIDQIIRLEKGLVPENGIFCTYGKFIEVIEKWA